MKYVRVPSGDVKFDMANPKKTATDLCRHPGPPPDNARYLHDYQHNTKPTERNNSFFPVIDIMDIIDLEQERKHAVDKPCCSSDAGGKEQGTLMFRRHDHLLSC